MNSTIATIMTAIRKLLILSVLILPFLQVAAQRTYKPNSVLASGNWFRISVSGEGIYKLDLPFLASLGIQGNIPSSQLRLFGNGGGMLPESNSQVPIDDLVENAIFVSDGGDGTLDGGDYVLFYAPGPHHWVKDSVNQRFSHRKNIYSDKAFYYLTIGGTGLRVGSQPGSLPASVTVNSFDERYFHELDTVNFLASGKQWYGEEFSNAPGRTLSRSFSLPLDNLLQEQATLVTDVAARSVNVPSRFHISNNNQPVQQLDVNPISTALYDLFAQQTQKADNFIPNQGTAVVTVSYQQGSFNSQGWLNWFEFFARRALAISGGKQLSFRDWRSVGMGNVEFILSNADAKSQVWDVTDMFHPVRMNTTLSGNQLRFTNDAPRLREYVCFSGQFLIPVQEGRVGNQNLHNTTEKDYI
ncbi:MAG TPA: hypothetical protein VGC29_10625, partial [Flavisolibacter sp.]